MDESSGNAPLHRQQRAVRHEQQSMLNHLLSIKRDSLVVAEIVAFLRKGGRRTMLPLYGNLRNGAWYCRRFDGLCYFKSTDGHDVSYGFSHSRVNLGLAAAAAAADGALVVDSTRRGKRFPDSMRVTIPLWCHVMNLLVFVDRRDELRVRLPPWVHPSLRDDITREAARMAEEVPAAIRDMVRAALCGKLLRPLQPVWVCPAADGTFEWFDDGDNGVDGLLLCDSSSSSSCTPVVLLSCSCAEDEQNPHAQHHSWHYIQGAGDDEENWAPRGLTPQLFWANEDRILGAARADEALAAATAAVQQARRAQQPVRVCGSAPLFHAGGGVVVTCAMSGINELYAQQSLEAVVATAEDGCGVCCSRAIVVLEPPTPYKKKDAPAAASSSPSSLLCRCGSREVLALFASSEKRDSTVQVAVWVQQLLPAAAAFCGPEGGAREKGVLLVCADGTLAGLLAVCLRLLWRGERARSKADVRSALLEYQIVAPCFSLPRRLVKVLNAYLLDGDWRDKG